ncbi:lipoate--protein ligase family protein [Leucobacter sp. cx-328]|uniref:lipoate--protein ligase family protein n=1 Tax=unclassified Leucobacter TaxID=2621730 RepID=UPI00165E7548|nr:MULTISPECIES: biotin/lipoate A/B protein ligase family protein [unclassified Leucobacter]MBC9944781.1 lipoate--protein ligase family protein [Leucobacter sp. cx-328]
MNVHGEYKVPGGKLVVVDFTIVDEKIADFSLSGDFFLEPDDALLDINAAVNGLSPNSTIEAFGDAIRAALPSEVHLLGFTPDSVGVAIRRAITGAAHWRDYDWQIIHERAVAPVLNAALDEVLTTAVGEGLRGPTLRIWEWDRPAVFIGSFQSVQNEVDEEQLNARGAQLVRRISGGGAMYMEPEACITYALYVPGELVRGMSFADSYAFLDEWVLEALHSLGIDAVYKPLNDITSPQGKIGGAAQKRIASGAVLHHVTMAYDMDPVAMTEVLRIGREKLSDKGTASAQKRVDPLRSQTGLSREEIVERLVEVFIRRHGGTQSEVTEGEWDAAEQLVEKKFLTEDWIRRVP